MSDDTLPSLVLDTNAALDWLAFADARSRPVGAAVAEGRVRWLATAAMRAEFAHVLGDGRFLKYAISSERALTQFDRYAELTEAVPALASLRCRDASDQMFVDLAVTSGARWLVTQDRDLLALSRRARYSGVLILPLERWPG